MASDQDLIEIPRSSQATISSSVAAKIKKLIGLREKHFGRMTAAHDLIASTSTRGAEFLARAGRADIIFKEFESVQDEIISLNSTIPQEFQVEVNSVFLSFEELYYKVKAKHASMTPPVSQQPQPSPTPSNNDPKARIPKIAIEPFTGDIAKFPSFKSLFDTLIHKSNLTDIEKFSYLRSLLQGKALNAIQTIEFHENNYLFAYNKLTEEFSNRRLVATHYFSRLLQVKTPPTETPEALQWFLDTFHVNCKALQDMQLPSLSDFILLHLALKAIPVETRKLFEGEQIGGRDLPTMDQLITFLKGRLSLLELMTEKPNRTSYSRSTAKASFMTTSSDQQAGSEQNSQNNAPLSGCKHCGCEHKLSGCPAFSKLPFSERWSAIKQLGLCFACFGSHNVNQCESRYSCRVCKQRSHHTLLHNAEKVPHTSMPSAGHKTLRAIKSPKPPKLTAPPDMQPKQKDEPYTQALACNFSPSHFVDKIVLLGTAMARVRDSNGFWHPIRLVIDPGSMVNFVTSALVQTLHLPRTSCHMDIAGIGNSKLQAAKGKVSVIIAPQSNEKKLEVSAIVLPNISAEMPSRRVSSVVADQLKDLPLADYSIFENPSKVDMLLGASHFTEILKPNGTVVPGQPSCLSTIFGYVVIGDVPASPVLSSSPPQSSLFTCVQEQDSLNATLKKFWETEEVVVPIPQNPEDVLCEQHFQRTHYRQPDGKFVVSLPFKGDQRPSLGSTRSIALQRLLSLEKRLEKSPYIKSLYHADLQGYIDEDQLEVATAPATYLLPHHAVVKESSSHPLRIVFNASQTSDTGETLNNSMYVGPKLQKDVGDLILLYRMHPISLCADIRQMYRAILLNPLDRVYQHILWRFSPRDPVQEWELKRLTFGFGPASYLAQKCIQTLAETQKEKYPNAAQVLLSGCYVDDIVTGANSIEEAKNLRKELVELLSLGGFTLKKFSSSSPLVLQDVPPEDQEQTLLFDSSESIKVLGLRWQLRPDSFCYSINVRSCEMTKRSLLSNAASIFDVNGYVTHLVIYIKILIQRLWLLKIDWDTPIPSPLQVQWSSFAAELPLIEQLHIPRYIAGPDDNIFDLVGFADASNQAIGAAVYLRVESPAGEVKCNLLRAKSKVAPLKVLSIPRLELTASHLLVKLLRNLGFLGQKLPIRSVYCFTDSTTVLAWIQTPPHLLKTFVANRVSDIIHDIPQAKWSHVTSQQNPADLASRGLLPSQVIETSEFWFHGPSFLLDSPLTWPAPPYLSNSVPECKMDTSDVLLARTSTSTEMIDWIGKFSSLLTLQRVMAWILRWKNRPRLKGPLLAHELNAATLICVKLTQQHYFKTELRNGVNSFPRSVRNLSPFISPAGILMVGGRLRHSPLSYASKHPMLIPHQSHLAKLLIRHVHFTTLHGNPKLVQSLIQRQYWITGARRLIKNEIFQCLKCYRLATNPSAPVMADIPPSRFTQGRCFRNVMVDYAGFFSLKDGHRRNSPLKKCYIVVFVCMSVKAIHLELATSLDLEACLAAIDRFVARRGLPECFYSDQGTNFKAASRHLDEVQNVLLKHNASIVDHISPQNVKWHLNPPGAPNFSGLAEAGVKSVKYHLKRVLNDRALTYEEFTTLLCKVEAILNSRPLCPLVSLPDEGTDYLTPGHFLIGAPLLSRPEQDFSADPGCLASRWKLLTQISQSLWKRWSKDYLNTQIQRNKWQRSTESLCVGDLVFMSSESTLPLHWPLARITKIFPGPDGVVRVAQLKTSQGNTFTRPVSKLVAFPSKNQ